MKLLSKTIFIFSILAISITGLSKTFSNKHFSIEDGLPSSEVYDALQDDEGYMWFATDRGVVRFDGYEFETFTTDEGLPDNVIFHLFKDHLGRIWFGSFSGKLSYFENGEIQLYKFNKTLERTLNFGVMLSIHVDQNEAVHIGAKEAGYIKIDRHGNVTLDTFNKRPYNIRLVENKILSYSNSISIHVPTKLRYFNQDELIEFDILNYEFSQGDLINATLFDPIKNIIYFSIGPYLFSINDDELQFLCDAKSQILKISLEKSGISLGLFQGGYLTYNSDRPKELHKAILKKLSITDIFRDSNDGLWLTTLEKGVFYFPDNTHYSYTQRDGLTDSHIHNIIANNEVLLISDLRGRLTEINRATLDISIIDTNSNNPIRMIKNEYTGDIVIERHGFKRTTYTSAKVAPDKQNGAGIIYIRPNALLLIITHNNHFKLAESVNDEYFPYETNMEIQGRSTFTGGCQTIDNRILLYSKNGIYELIKPATGSIHKLKHYKKTHPLFGTRTIKIDNLLGFDFIVATRGEGILFVKNNIPYALKKEHGLLSNQITCMSVDRDQTIWVGTSQGLTAITKEDGLIHFRMENGLISNEVTSLYAGNTNVYVGTKKGLTVVNKKKLRKSSEDIPVFIKKITLQNNIQLIPENHTIYTSYKEPILDIKFVGLSYRSIGSIKYKYRLNRDKEWLYTDNSRLLLTNLPSGDYQLEIYASNVNNNWSKQPAILEIHVAYPFWRTDSFIIALSLGSAFLLFGLYRLTLRRIKKREAIKRQVQNLRFEALNAQMNPHFIFNSLNSIQHFIMTNDKRESTRYLSKFAKLMRKTLDHSQEQNVTIEEELNALTLYLELEALRFDNLITFEIQIAPEINPSRAILPALLIQPIVENAILHGLRPKKTGGHINISIKKKNDLLYIAIIDNGVGRETAMLEKRKLHSSKGSTLTKERVALFAKDYNAESNYNIIDLYENDKSSGTEVNIKLPLILKL